MMARIAVTGASIARTRPRLTPRPLSIQLDVNPGAAISGRDGRNGSAGYPPGVDDLQRIAPPLRARTPGVIAGPRDIERAAHDPHRVLDTAIFDEAETSYPWSSKDRDRTFFKMSRSMRSRSFLLLQTGNLRRLVRRRQRPPGVVGALRRRRRLPPGPTVLHPPAQYRNRAGQVPWPPTRSSSDRSKPPDRPPAAYTRPVNDRR